jgi:hypothetical protein
LLFVLAIKEATHLDRSQVFGIIHPFDFAETAGSLAGCEARIPFET